MSLDITAWATVAQTLTSAAALGITGYLFWKKIGYSLSATFSIESDTWEATRINNITITNHKDRAITIYNLYAEISDIALLEDVETITPPLTIPPYESRLITTSPFSYYSGYDISDQIFFEFRGITFIAITERKIVRIKARKVDGSIAGPRYSHLKRSGKVSKRFNGKIYVKSDKYAITYTDSNGNLGTAIADDNIIRGLPWGLTPYDSTLIIKCSDFNALLNPCGIHINKVNRLN